MVSPRRSLAVILAALLVLQLVIASTIGCSSTPAAARRKFALGLLADVATTQYGIQRFGAQEANPVLGSKPMVGIGCVTLLQVTLAELLFSSANRAERRGELAIAAARRKSALGIYDMGGNVHLGAAAWNGYQLVRAGEKR